MKKHWILLILLLLFIIGFVIIDAYGYHFVKIKDFDKIVSYILQIQATISALGIALLSFIANRSDEEYFGITVTRFSFEQLGAPLSPKNCVILTLVLIPVSIGLYCFGLYNSVVAIFIVSLFFILRIFTYVCITFKSKRDIRSILFQSVSKKIVSDERTVSDFFDSFKNAILNQSIDIIDEYAEKTKTLYRLFLHTKEKKNYRLFCEKLGFTCDYLLKSKTPSKMESGVNLIMAIFTMYRDSEIVCEDNDPDIISQCQISICEVFEETDNPSIRFDLCYHLPFIILGTEITDERIGPDASPWYSIGKAFGFHAGKTNDQAIIKRMVPTGSDLYRFSKHPYKKDIIRFLTYYKTGFAISILNCGKANQSFNDYVEKMISKISSDDESFVSYILTLIVYGLYICIFETEVHIPDSTRQECRLLLSKIWKPSKEIIKDAIYTNSFSLINYEKQFSKVLRQEELFNEDEAKFMVMDHAIRESIIIIFAICIEIEPYYSSLVEEYVDKEGFTFFSIVNNKENSCKTIKKTLELLREESYIDSTIDLNDRYIDELYFRIKSAIEKAFKNGEIKQANDLENELGNLEERDKMICQQLENEITKMTDGIKSTNENELDSTSVPILLNIYTSLISYKDNNYLQVFPLFTKLLIGRVFEQIESVSNIESINPNNPEEMERFFNLLGNYDTVIGSEPFIRYENRAIKDEYQRVINTKKTLFVSAYPGKMIMFDSASNFFHFKDFSVKSRLFTKEEILNYRAVKKKGRNQYAVNIANDIWLSFTEEELVSYYSAYMKVIHFSCTGLFKFSNATIIQFTR